MVEICSKFRGLLIKTAFYTTLISFPTAAAICKTKSRKNSNFMKSDFDANKIILSSKNSKKNIYNSPLLFFISTHSSSSLFLLSSFIQIFPKKKLNNIKSLSVEMEHQIN